MPHKLLILGGPNVGKTHYIGQLHLRLTHRASAGANAFRMHVPTQDMTVINDVVNQLEAGRAAGHTASGFNKQISFTVADAQGLQVELTFPDYAGEQVRDIVSKRLIDSRWQELITQADEWLLFIRSDKVNPLEDITNRSLAHLTEQQPRAQEGVAEGEMTEPAFYIELLQMLLHCKGQSALAPARRPRLTVALTCWDTLPAVTIGTTPAAELRRCLPFLADFLTAAWEPTAWRVFGLSSTGTTLDPHNPNDDFVDAPHKQGYVVLPDGQRTSDLTLLIAP